MRLSKLLLVLALIGVAAALLTQVGRWLKIYSSPTISPTAIIRPDFEATRVAVSLAGGVPLPTVTPLPQYAIDRLLPWEYPKSEVDSVTGDLKWSIPTAHVRVGQTLAVDLVMRQDIDGVLTSNVFTIG
jgi:hypothetical protein